MPPEFETETFRRVFCNEDGSYIEIGPDADGLQCIEVKYQERGKETHNSARLTMPPNQAELVAKAILEAVKDMRQSGPTSDVLIRGVGT